MVTFLVNEVVKGEYERVASGGERKMNLVSLEYEAIFYKTMELLSLVNDSAKQTRDKMSTIC